MDLSVVLPTYNERENIAVLIPRLEAAFASNRLAAEIIVVDDDSPDGTAAEAARLGERHGNVRVVVRRGERGIGSAWFRGFSEARGAAIACMDADLCHDPEDLMRMYRALPGSDIVIGSRYLPGSGGMRDKSAVALLASRLAQRLTGVLLGMQGTDLTHSFRVFRREVFSEVKDRLRSNGNVWLVEFLYAAVRCGRRFREVPIVYGARCHGVTKLQLAREGPRFLWRILMLRLRA